MSNDDKYIKGETLGVGTFASVVKATVKETGQEVAIKKVRIAAAKEGIDVTALREIKVLRELHSPHVIELVDVYTSSNQNLSIVLELMDSDLEAVIKDTSLILSPADVKSYMRMALDGLATCHAHNVVHRDIKPNNLLTSKTGLLKLADFGMAKIYGSPEGCRTSQVFARWYRAPELLWGSTSYGPAVDVWAMGCVFAELMLRRPWFVAESDIKQLQEIFAVLGTPTEDQWRDMHDLPSYIQFSPAPAQPLHKIFTQANEDALDLLGGMMRFDPRERITAAEALQHNYFQKGVKPTPPERLPRPKSRVDAPLLNPAQNNGEALSMGTEPTNQTSCGHSLNFQGQAFALSERFAWHTAFRDPVGASLLSCLDSLVDGVCDRHSRHAKPLPCPSRGSNGSVSWSPAQSLSMCTDSGISMEYTRTPRSCGDKVQGRQRFGAAGRCWQQCSGDGSIVSRLRPPSATWQPLSSSHIQSPCAHTHTADGKWMLSPLDLCAYIPDKKRKDSEENCSSVQNSPANPCVRIKDSSKGHTSHNNKEQAVHQGVIMRQLDLLAPGIKAADTGTPSLWSGQKSQGLRTNTGHITDANTPKSAALGNKDRVEHDAAGQCGHDYALNPFSMFCGTGAGKDAGSSAVPTPVKDKLRRNLFGPD